MTEATVKTPAFIVARPRDEAAWDRFVAESPQGSVFVRSCFFRAHGAVAFETWLVSDGDVPILGAVMLRDSDGQALARGFPFARPEVFFGASVLALPIHRRTKTCLEALQALLAHFEKRGESMRWRCHPELSDVRPFHWFHYHQPDLGRFTVDARVTGWIDLTRAANFDAYLSTIRQTRRNEYRQALRHELRATPTDDVDEFDYLHRLTFDRQGLERDPVEARLLMQIAKAAARDRFGEILVARLTGGEPVSATLFLHDDVSGHYVAGASHPEYRKLYGGTFCFLESIRKCMNRGLARVDVCGINSPNRGDFKTSFNAEPKTYFEARWARADTTN